MLTKKSNNFQVGQGQQNCILPNQSRKSCPSSSQYTSRLCRSKKSPLLFTHPNAVNSNNTNNCCNLFVSPIIWFEKVSSHFVFNILFMYSLMSLFDWIFVLLFVHMKQKTLHSNCKRREANYVSINICMRETDERK